MINALPFGLLFIYTSYSTRFVRCHSRGEWFLHGCVCAFSEHAKLYVLYEESFTCHFLKRI